jgi:hypothetical protein
VANEQSVGPLALSDRGMLRYPGLQPGLDNRLGRWPERDKANGSGNDANGSGNDANGSGSNANGSGSNANGGERNDLSGRWLANEAGCYRGCKKFK